MADNERLIFGLPMNAVTMDGVVAICRSALESRETTLVGVVNAAKIVHLRRDERLRNALLECRVIVADGQSVVWASRLLGKRLPERITGIDLFEQLLDMAHRQGHSVYLLGARPEVLDKMVQRLADRFPGLRIAGAQDGYFDESDSSAVAARIAASKADMLFLGMTSPKKEIFLGNYGDDLGVPILHGVGGSFDIMAGVTRRAPVRMQRMGLEWLFRLFQEPTRLWRRYLMTNTEFLWLTLREYFRPAPRYAANSAQHDRQSIYGPAA